MTIFERTHKQTGEIIRGTWDEVCDLDKRLWSEPIDANQEDDPIMLVELFINGVLKGYKSEITYVQKHQIYSLSDLNGIYLG